MVRLLNYFFKNLSATTGSAKVNPQIFTVLKFFINCEIDEEEKGGKFVEICNLKGKRLAILNNIS